VVGCFHNDPTYADQQAGGGIAPDGTMILWSWAYTADNNFPGDHEGCWWSRSTDNGVTWSVPQFYSGLHTQTAYLVAPQSLLVVPAGSPGVTGPCASGCVAQILGVDSATEDLLFSYDDGQTWPDEKVMFPQTITNGLGYITENEIIWVGGNTLLGFARSSLFASSNGGPQRLIFISSTDMGTTWNGALTNFPIENCPSGTTAFMDVYPQPILLRAPVQPNLMTLFYGERASCLGIPSTVNYYLRSLTFNPYAMLSDPTGYPTTPARVTDGIGPNGVVVDPVQGIYVPQYLYAMPFLGTTGNWGYMWAVPLTSTTLLIAFEQTTGNNNADQIYTMTATYQLR